MALFITNRRPPPPPEAGTGPSEPLRTLVFKALGTECRVVYVASSDERAAAFERAAQTWVAGFEARYSRFQPESALNAINRAAGGDWVSIDPEMEQMLRLAGALHRLSGGILDATSAPLLSLWDYRLAHASLPSEAEIESARALVGWDKVVLEPGRVRLPLAGMALDFGGFGKEWAVDAVAEIARQQGIAAALVDLGHDLRMLGLPPGRSAWAVGLEDPRNPGSAAGSLSVPPGKGVASSGDYMRHFEHQGRRYGHIVDPRSGRPVSNGCLQSTVIADTCLRAGALSTTAFVLGPVEGIRFIQTVAGAEGMIVTADGRAQTRGFWNYLAD